MSVRGSPLLIDGESGPGLKSREVIFTKPGSSSMLPVPGWPPSTFEKRKTAYSVPLLNWMGTFPWNMELLTCGLSTPIE